MVVVTIGRDSGSCSNFSCKNGNCGGGNYKCINESGLSSNVSDVDVIRGDSCDGVYYGNGSAGVVSSNENSDNAMRCCGGVVAMVVVVSGLVKVLIVAVMVVAVVTLVAVVAVVAVAVLPWVQ